MDSSFSMVIIVPKNSFNDITMDSELSISSQNRIITGIGNKDFYSLFRNLLNTQYPSFKNTLLIKEKYFYGLYLSDFFSINKIIRKPREYAIKS